MVNTLSSGSVTLKKRNDKNGSLAGSQWQLFTADDKAVSVIQTILILIGAGLGIWGVVNLLEGYGNDNRATRSLLKRQRVMAGA